MPKIWEGLKKIPCYIPLLDLLIMVTKSIYSQVIKKTGSLSNYKLLLTCLNLLEMIQLHCFIEHPRFHCLNS